MTMDRRTFLLGGAALGSAVAGCSNGSAPSSNFLNDSDTRVITGRVGLQAILLPLLGTDSMTNLKNVFKDSKGGFTKGPSNIALSFCPYLRSPASSYGNATDLINTWLSAGKNVSVTVFLDRGTNIHATGSKADNDNIKKSATDFRDNFLKTYINTANLSINVCPALEDSASNKDVVNTWAKDIADILGKAYTSSVNFRRNPNNSDHKHMPSGQGYKSYQRELHGSVPANGDANVYSNDGWFIGYDKETMTDPGQNGGKPKSAASLATLKANIISQGFTGTVNIWRPGMNLFVRTTNNKGVRDYSKSGRDFTDSQVSFDATEAKFLADFFALKR